jgi:hypothetical protein
MKAPTENSRQGGEGLPKAIRRRMLRISPLMRGLEKHLILGLQWRAFPVFYRGRPFVYGVYPVMLTPLLV